MSSVLVFGTSYLAEVRFPSQASNFAQSTNPPRADVLATHSERASRVGEQFSRHLGYTGRMMSKTDPHPAFDSGPDSGLRGAASSTDDWHQFETFVDQLQELSRAPIEAGEFYRELLEGCVTLLAADGGAVWQPHTDGRWVPIHQVNLDQILRNDDAAQRSSHDELLAKVGRKRDTTTRQPHSGTPDRSDNPTASVAILVPVVDAIEVAPNRNGYAIVELFMRPGLGPEVLRGSRELLETIATVATDFHVHEQLRALRDERGLYDQSLALIRRTQQSTDLRQTAYAIANEGRTFVGADRLSVIVRLGADWKLIAASGADRVEPRADVTKRLQELAAATSEWGEPVEYCDADAPSDSSELPPKLEAIVTRHVDESQARTLVATAVRSNDSSDSDPTDVSPVDAVLVAEQFTSDDLNLSKQHLLELAVLCEPALRQAVQLSRFPIRACLQWADRWQRLRDHWGITKLTASVAVAILAVSLLILVRVDYEVEAQATLKPEVERDVFATTDGKIVDVTIVHSQRVQAGDVLALLSDPQLSLDTQRVEGEIATTRKRLEAIAVVRTDRQVREEVNNDKMPLSAEAEQLEKQLASLQLQLKILKRRRDGLKLRSPIDGTVLTLDVQNLLQSRPVKRGQLLFTVADTSSGWRLTADVPQDRIGQVVAAQRQHDGALPVRFRVAGETGQTFAGHVESISTAAVVTTDDLDQPSPPFEVKVDIDSAELLAARPGMAAQAKIYCGQRSLGYVWLHDIWETLYGWLVF
ncbi:MAG: efflux RND transporter periplasmic adaptor subunit [Planctomycetota bacterium]